MFITFFSSEGRDKFEHQHHEGPGARLRFWIFPLPRSRPCTERIPLILLQLFGWDCHGNVCSHSQQRPRPYIRSQKVSSLKTELLTAHLASARKTPFKIWCIVIFKKKKGIKVKKLTWPFMGRWWVKFPVCVLRYIRKFKKTTGNSKGNDTKQNIYCSSQL